LRLGRHRCEKASESKAKLICQVAFVEWTDADHLRHCTFIAMRDDKKVDEVIRET
jgi:bifunctional non-homologous end joining protein LigD